MTRSALLGHWILFALHEAFHAANLGDHLFDVHIGRRKGLDQNKINREFPTRMRGVVEKCNFCADRLGRGEQPACVEATGDSEAMVFGDLNDPNSRIRQVLKKNFTIQRKPNLGTKPSVFFII